MFECEICVFLVVTLLIVFEPVVNNNFIRSDVTMNLTLLVQLLQLSCKGLHNFFSKRFSCGWCIIEVDVSFPQCLEGYATLNVLRDGIEVLLILKSLHDFMLELAKQSVSWSRVALQTRSLLYICIFNF